MNINMEKEEYLKLAKERALKLLDSGQFKAAIAAIASILSDMKAHEKLKNNPSMDVFCMLALSGNLESDKEIRDWIETIN